MEVSSSRDRFTNLFSSEELKKGTAQKGRQPALIGPTENMDHEDDNKTANQLIATSPVAKQSIE